jgi:hypothetical protein
MPAIVDALFPIAQGAGSASVIFQFHPTLENNE